MPDDFIWDGGKIEQGRRIGGSGYIIGSVESHALGFAAFCEGCGSQLAGVTVRLVSIGGGEMVTGGFVQSGWVWCPACRERRQHIDAGASQ
jgi:hypothetical protein